MAPGILDRRQFLASATAGLTVLIPTFGNAIGARTQVVIGLLSHGGGHQSRPGAVEQLMWEVKKRTSIDVRETPAVVDALAQDMHRWPLLIWVGTGSVEPLGEPQVRRLARFLRAGGLLYIDDASPRGDDAFDAQARSLISQLWPEEKLVRVSNDHTIYRSFFLLKEPSGRVRRQPWLEAITFDDRCPILYGRNDLLGAFGRDPVGSWRLPVEGGNTAREMAFRFGINLLMYATCLNYKRDQVHVTEILRRRRWRVDGQGPTQ